MIDLNTLRAEFAKRMAAQPNARFSMDSALLAVCQMAYDAGMRDARAPAQHVKCDLVKLPPDALDALRRDAHKVAQGERRQLARLRDVLKETQWTPHKPGDPMPCDASAMVCVQYSSGGCSVLPIAAGKVDWPIISPYSIIGWRYADA